MQTPRFGAVRRFAACSMHSIKQGGGSAIFAASLVMSLGAFVGAPAASAAPAGGTYANCHYGAACLYPGNSFAGTPVEYYTYGSHNLSNVTGLRYFLNNQSGGAIAYLCTGYNGTGSCFRVNAYYYTPNFNFTPINSIYLSPYS